MVAISLYRGNLHRVSEVPRRWLMPTPQISLKDFRALLSRRFRALSRLRSSADTSSNPNPTSVSDHQQEPPKEDPGASRPETRPKTDKVAADWGEGPSGESKDGKDSNFNGSAEKKPVENSDSLPEPKPNAPEGGGDPVDDGAKPQVVEVQKVEEFANPNSEREIKEDLPNEKQKRKTEVEEKLQVLNNKKHNLVLLLKQILHAEEELKRRINMHGIAVRPSAPLQVDATNDSVSMTRHVALRMGSEPNLSGDVEGAETDALSNQNFHSRQIFRMNSTSPSSESPIRRPPFIQHNVASHPTSRTSLGATGSPLRFTPVAHQGHPANLPTLSVSGTNYIASSPSPAASGGTSTFRDSRLPSPWN